MDSFVQRAPSLPFATKEYDRLYQDQFANVLRIYFNYLDSLNQQSVVAINSNGVMNWMSNGGGIFSG